MSVQTHESRVFDLSGSVGAGGRNRSKDVLAVKRRLIALGHTWLKANSTVDRATLHSIRLFQAIKNGFQVISGHKEVDGVVSPGRDTHLWLQAANAPRWQLMPLGTPDAGFTNVERLDRADKHDWGTDWIGTAIGAIAAAYREAHLSRHTDAALMMVNDVSLTRGGDTPDHERHETGLGCDLRLQRKPADLPGRVLWQDAAYDREATRELLKAIRQHPLFSLVYLNDPVLIDEGLCEQYHGHDDHIHFEIRPPGRQD